jgi:hypothetical protein
MSMGFNLPHHVRTRPLTKSNSLLPLYEAIVNSFQAVSERPGAGHIEVIANRDLAQATLAPTGPEPINSFEVVDDGIGFTADHLESFRIASSPKKASVGGKGIGRFLWLKAFDRVEVTSIYQEGAEFFERRFTFELDDEGVHADPPTPSSHRQHRTSVRLTGFKNPYRDVARHSLDVLARRILGHCLIYLMAPQCPVVIVRDDHDSINLNDVFQQEVRPRSRQRRFSVKEYAFAVSNFSVYSSTAEHLIHFCADDREVNHVKLTDPIPELATGRLRDAEGRAYHIAAYVTGGYLDDNVSRDRTDFGFEEDAPVLGGLQKSELTGAVANIVREEFREEIDLVARSNMADLRKFIEDNPEFRVLNSHPEELKSIHGSAPRDKLRVELYKARDRVRENIRKTGRELLEVPEDLEETAEYEKRFISFVTDLNELGKSELANYVIHRRVVLDLLQKALRRAPSGKYQLEEAVHRLIFPLRTTSDSVEFEQQNLWIIDERLAFHRYLASDKPLRSVDEGDFDSGKRPDLLIFNKPHAFAEDLYPIQSIVLVEFKRPMRNDYTAEENPLGQVYGYIREIRAGKVLTHDGRPIDVKDSTPFHVWVICDLTKKARDQAQDYNFRKTPDGVGMFHLHPEFNAYIELIPFEKMVGDAEKRNKVLFEMLNLPS